MNIDKMVMAIFGAVIVITVILSQIHSQAWLWITGLLGLHMFQLSFTGFCWLGKKLKKSGFKPGKIFE